MPSSSSNLSVMSLLSTLDRKEHNEWIYSKSFWQDCLYLSLWKHSTDYFHLLFIHFILIIYLGALAILGVLRKTASLYRHCGEKIRREAETPISPWWEFRKVTLNFHPKQLEDTFWLGKCICSINGSQEASMIIFFRNLKRRPFYHMH